MAPRLRPPRPDYVVDHYDQMLEEQRTRAVLVALAKLLGAAFAVGAVIALGARLVG